jgi:hypothetical protein
MATGHPAFGGESGLLITSIMSREPDGRDFEPTATPTLDRVIRVAS